MTGRRHLGSVHVTVDPEPGVDFREVDHYLVNAMVDLYMQRAANHAKQANKGASDREVMAAAVAAADEWARRMFPRLRPKVTYSFSDAS